MTDTIVIPASTLSPDEIAELRTTVREVAEATGGIPAVRLLESATEGPGYSAGAWKALAGDVGLGGLGLPEEQGGIGGLAEVLAVAEELGASLTPVPFLSSTVLAGQVLLRCNTSEALEALERVASGEVAGLAVADDRGRWTPEGVGVTADGIDGAVTLSGVVPFVLDGADAALLVVAAAGTAGVDVYLVDPVSPGVTARRMPTLDLSRSMGEIALENAPAIALTSGGSGIEAISGGVDVGLLTIAAEQLGGAQAAFTMTLEYIKMRRQFGREIGSFQAIKHRMADLLSLVEQARSSIVRATLTDLGPAELAEAAAVAKSYCSDAFRTVTAEAVQLHGGIGFTWEHDAHLYFRRARADAAILGDAAFHRERLATLHAF